MTRLISEHMKRIEENRNNKLVEILEILKQNDPKKIKEEAIKLAVVSTNFLLSAFELEYRQVTREGPSQLLVCIGTEMLLNAIIASEAPIEFVKLYEQRNKIPSYEVIKTQSQRIINVGFSQTQKRRMTDVLSLIQSKRNLFSHFSLGFHAMYYQHFEMLNVICYLLEKYFPNLPEPIQHLKTIKERFRFKDDKDYDYVVFEIVEPEVRALQE